MRQNRPVEQITSAVEVISYQNDVRHRNAQKLSEEDTVDPTQRTELTKPPPVTEDHTIETSDNSRTWRTTASFLADVYLCESSSRFAHITSFMTL